MKPPASVAVPPAVVTATSTLPAACAGVVAVICVALSTVNEVAFVLLSDDALLEFNRRYLHHDDYTDVITFDGQTGTGVSGDVLMSHDRIRENAKAFGVSTQHELRRVMVHGLLHLLGHSDKSKAKRDAMRVLEDKYLARYR